ncbi:MAG: AraC family transcriptional regulator ligand-binding domain-containing protein [Propionibacteriales bacterium]|nr:AraC family transcriptional regulator ligand-binding domain-containing protein [Propionibacteriales bacterium]
MELVRAALLRAQAQGWDIDAILRSAGLPSSLVNTDRGRVTEAQAVRLVRLMWDTTGDEIFGTGDHDLPRGSFRLLCFGALGAPDLGAALERVGGFAQAMPALPRIRAVSDGGLTRVSLDLSAPQTDPTGVAVVTSLALVHRMAAWAIARPLELEQVEFPGPVPVSPEMVDLVFGAVAVAHAPAAAVVFRTKWLSARIIRDEADLERFIASSPAGLFTRPGSLDASLVSRVRALVVRALGGEQPGAEEVASALMISGPTLRRRLAAAGTSIREIRDAVLRDAAVHALVEGDWSIADISHYLGFSEPSAFTRAFRRWTGSAPRQYRETPEEAAEPESEITAVL